MDGSSQPQSEWEQWPGRGAPDRPRRGLRALFAATDGTDAIEELIDQHGRELEERAASLRLAILDLEEREERVRTLRASVDALLREGSAELDERHAELAVAAQELADRETTLARLEAELEERRSELGAVELRRAAVERREAALDERQAELERLAGELRQRVDDVEHRAAELDERAATTARAAHELAERDADLARRSVELDERGAQLSSHAQETDERAAQLARRAAELDERLSAATEPSAPSHPTHGPRSDAHLLVVPGLGYRLLAQAGPVPSEGEVLELDGTRYRVTRSGRSPLPGDDRRCAYLEPARA